MDAVSKYCKELFLKCCLFGAKKNIFVQLILMFFISASDTKWFNNFNSLGLSFKYETEHFYFLLNHTELVHLGLQWHDFLKDTKPYSLHKNRYVSSILFNLMIRTHKLTNLFRSLNESAEIHALFHNILIIWHLSTCYEL